MCSSFQSRPNHHSVSPHLCVLPNSPHPRSSLKPLQPPGSSLTQPLPPVVPTGPSLPLSSLTGPFGPLPLRTAPRPPTLAGPLIPKQVTPSVSSTWSSAHAHWRLPGVARHRLLQPPLFTRHLLVPTAKAWPRGQGEVTFRKGGSGDRTIIMLKKRTWKHGTGRETGKTVKLLSKGLKNQSL